MLSRPSSKYYYVFQNLNCMVIAALWHKQMGNLFCQFLDPIIWLDIMFSCPTPLNTLYRIRPNWHGDFLSPSCWQSVVFSCWYFHLFQVFIQLELAGAACVFHSILPQTGRLCFPNLLFLSTMHSVTTPSSSKPYRMYKSAQRYRFTTLSSFTFSDWPISMNVTPYNKPSTQGCFCTDYTVDPQSYQTPIIGIMLVWKRHAVTTCSEMDFLRQDLHSYTRLKRPPQLS